MPDQSNANAFVVNFPEGDGVRPTVYFSTNTQWEQGVFIYEVLGDTLVLRGDTSNSGHDNSKNFLLPSPTDRDGRRLLIWMMHKAGPPNGALPWITSRMRILWNAPTDRYEHPLLLTFTSEDGVNDSWNDSQVNIAYGSPHPWRPIATYSVLPDDIKLPDGWIDRPQVIPMRLPTFSS